MKERQSSLALTRTNVANVKPDPYAALAACPIEGVGRKQGKWFSAPGGWDSYAKMGTHIPNFRCPVGVRWDPLRRRIQSPVNTGPADPQTLRDLGCSNAFVMQASDLRRFGSCCWSPPLVFPFGLSLGNAFTLPLKH
jgi:hypothetical protein